MIFIANILVAIVAALTMTLGNAPPRLDAPDCEIECALESC